MHQLGHKLKCHDSDLLKRHVAGHDARGDHEEARRASTIRPGRVTKACEACAEVHLRCDEQKPCTRCRKKAITCIYNPSAPDPDNAARNVLGPVQGEGFTADTASVDPDTHDMRAEESMPPPPLQSFDAQQILSIDEPRENSHLGYPTNTDYTMVESTGLDHTYDIEGNMMHDFLQSIMGGGDSFLTTTQGQTSGTWTPRNVFDFGQDTNLELNDLDFGFLNDYNLQNPFAASVESPEATQSARGSVTSNPPSALGGESLQRTSTWKFRPVTQDSSSSEQNNLSLPAAEANKRILVERRMTAEPLSYNMRDRILAIMISSCRGNNIPRFVLCFPSLELLDSLLQFYLASKFAMFSGLIHLPTLRPSKLRPELVAAMIAAGASLTPDASLRKIGFAIQEALRVTVPELFEGNNTLIADLQCLQCMGICLGIGLWSGNSRKMELSESFLQPFMTMIRRRGWFLRSAYPSISPSAEDEGSVLEDKWLAWIDQECRKRLVFFYYLHAIRQSISLFTNPLVSYAEMGLPLPAGRDLWLASSANQWKASYLSRADACARLPSLADLLHDVDLLADPHALFNIRLSSEILLGAAWVLIWDYRQVCSIMRGQHTQWSTSSLVLTSRLAELTKLLDCIRISAPTDPQTTLFLELLLMHVHVPLEEVHLLAGAEGHEEARRVYPQLQEWAKTSAAREAVSHAAQLVAAARKVGQGCLRDFWAIAVYQAALTLWSYGVISNAAATDNTSAIGGPSPIAAKRKETVFVLDGDDRSGTQRFIALNRGQGAINGSMGDKAGQSTVPLSEPGAVMGLLIDLFRMNHKTLSSLPPLVSNLASLMEGLQAAVTGSPIR